MSLHDIPGLHIIQAPFLSIAAATATGYVAVVQMPFKAKVIWAKVITVSAVTGDNTNTHNLNVDKVVGGVATEITNLDLATGTDIAALTPTLLGTDSTLDVALAEGDLVALEREKVGTGSILPTGTLVVAIQGN